MPITASKTKDRAAADLRAAADHLDATGVPRLRKEAQRMRVMADELSPRRVEAAVPRAQSVEEPAEE